MNYSRGIIIRNPMASINYVVDISEYEESWAEKRKDELISQIMGKYRFWNKILKIPIYIISFLLCIALSYSPFYFLDFRDIAILQSFASALISLQLIRVSIMIISDWIILKPKHKGKRLSTLYF